MRSGWSWLVFALTACGPELQGHDEAGATTRGASSTGDSLPVATSSGGGNPEGTSTSDTTATSGAACPSSHACVLAAPSGWEGPIALADAREAEQNPCPDGYPNALASRGSDLQAPPAACQCTCGTPTETTCAATATLRSYAADDATCDGNFTGTQVLVAGLCTALELSDESTAGFMLATTEVTGGSCQAETTADVLDPSFASEFMLCGSGPLDPLGCDPGQVCAPRPPDHPLCIWREGEHTCPEAYREQRMLYDAWTDDRSCSECTCGPPKGVCEAAIAYLYPLGQPGGQCSGSPMAATHSALCTGSLPTPAYARYIPTTGQVQAFCDVAEGGEPTGVAAPAEPTTVCCRANG